MGKLRQICKLVLMLKIESVILQDPKKNIHGHEI